MSKDTSTGSVRDIRIQQALENWDAYVAELATLSDSQLSEKLDVINLQSEIARQKNNLSSIELLEIWWRQVVEARIYKAENNIPDAPDEIELAIADIETFTAKAEERNEIFSEDLIIAKPVLKKKEENSGDNNQQLSLF